MQFRSTMEGKLPQYNTRIKLPQAQERMAGYDGGLHAWIIVPVISFEILLLCFSAQVVVKLGVLYMIVDDPNDRDSDCDRDGNCVYLVAVTMTTKERTN